ncbi:hypothetical protein T484DRAFT_3134997 [Baffinella frigidus]|nr:hypothetical protein T484DRAFT_3134997 [Cryptophyta sp. CCMP2293]
MGIRHLCGKILDLQFGTVFPPEVAILTGCRVASIMAAWQGGVERSVQRSTRGTLSEYMRARGCVIGVHEGKGVARGWQGGGGTHRCKKCGWAAQLRLSEM